MATSGQEEGVEVFFFACASLSKEVYKSWRTERDGASFPGYVSADRDPTERGRIEIGESNITERCGKRYDGDGSVGTSEASCIMKKAFQIM